MTHFKEKANLIWEVADLLRGDYKQSDYGKVILPMTVLRRLDCVLAPNKQKVLDYLPKVEKLSDSAKDLTFVEDEKGYTLCSQLSWSHIRLLCGRWAYSAATLAAK